MAAESVRPEESIRYVTCGVGDTAYSLEMSWVRSIQRVERMVPNTEPHGPVGWLPSRDGDIPLFSLATQLRMESAQVSQRPMAVVLHARPKPWAMLVDTVSRVSEVSRDRVYDIPPLLYAGGRHYFSSVMRSEERGMVFLLEPDDIRTGGATNSHPEPAAAAPQPTGKKKKRRGASSRIMTFSTLAHSGERRVIFGFSVTQVAEVFNRGDIMPVPGAPPIVLGMHAWRDRPVPVVDISAIAGVSAPPQEQLQRFAVVRGTGLAQLLAFPIDQVVGSLTLPIANRPIQAATKFSPTFVRGAVELDKETLIIPDVTGILSQS